MNSMPTLIRREFWEHKPLWIAPLAVSVCLLLITIVIAGNITLPDFEGRLESGPNALGAQAFFKSGILVGVLLFQFMIAAIVVGFYVLDCLYAERKDRSILFWKSLPVSDTSTVLSKFTVATVIMPLGVFVLAGITSLLAAGVVTLRADGLAPHVWDTQLWLRAYGTFFVALIAGILWYTPVIAYLMLVSAWARGSAVMWAFLPPFGLAILEGYAFGSHYVSEFLRYRLGFPVAIFLEAKPDGTMPHLNILGFLASPSLWLGMAAAALLLFGAIRIRRFRDDT
jgi:ABC-2 type transport system permease protein